MKKLSRAQKTTLGKPATAAYIEGKRQFLLDTNSAFLLDTNQLSTAIEKPRVLTPGACVDRLPPRHLQ